MLVPSRSASSAAVHSAPGCRSDRSARVRAVGSASISITPLSSQWRTASGRLSFYSGHMRIAVTTPTGHVGSHVVAMLVRAGVRPLVLARDPDRLAPELRCHVEVGVVDQFDADAVVEATSSGVDSLFWVDPPSSGDDPLAD